MNITVIKIIALIFMTADHIAKYFGGILPEWLRIGMLAAGRAAAPLFMFAMVIGAEHTSSRKKYLLRLYLANIIITIAAIPFTVSNVLGRAPQIIGTLFVTLFYIMLIEGLINSKAVGERVKYALGIAALTFVPYFIENLLTEQLCGFVGGISDSHSVSITTRYVMRALFPSVRYVDYSPIFVAMGVVLYFLKNKYARCLTVTAVGALAFAGVYIFNVTMFVGFFGSAQFLMVLAVPFIFAYNGEKGKGMKWLFYVYYPLHLVVFALIGELLAVPTPTML